jgi:hypothetical protein
VKYADGILSKDLPTELARLRSIEELCDPISRAAIESLSPQPGWRCADAGAGAGSIASWLAQTATVVATDLDPRYLTPGDRLTALTHDVTAEPPPGGPFDLVHARFLLETVPSRVTAARRLTEWLAPGGHLVVVGIDLSVSAFSPHPALRAASGALLDLFREQLEVVPTFTRSLPPLLAAHGLTSITLTVHPLIVGDGGPGERTMRATFEQAFPVLIDSGRLTAAQADETRAWFGQPGHLDILGLIPVVMAQRPR